MKWFCRVVVGMLLAIVAVATVHAADSAASAGEDAGYFLSARQKGQLIWRGRIEDSQGRWYDVWICPGYVAPSKYAWTHIKKSGTSFHEYVEAEKYAKMRKESHEWFDWAIDDCITDCIVEGVPRDWNDFMDTAHNRVEQRVFGSVLAYPWAVMEGVVSSVARVVGGGCGMMFGSATAAVGVPAWHMINSGLEGTTIFLGQGVAVPLLGYAWNTIVSPPLALLGGPKPAPSSVDGRWIRMVDNDGSDSDELLREKTNPVQRSIEVMGDSAPPPKH